MSRNGYILLTALYTVILTAIVIVVPRYYDGPALLIGQIALIAGPTLLPFVILGGVGIRTVASWIAVAVLLSIGWGYTVYVDTRPYVGGGASFAIFFGWAGSAFVSMIAVIAAMVGRGRVVTQDSPWRKPPDAQR